MSEMRISTYLKCRTRNYIDFAQLCLDLGVPAGVFNSPWTIVYSTRLATIGG